MDSNKTRLAESNKSESSNQEGFYGRSSNSAGLNRTYIQGMKPKIVDPVSKSPVEQDTRALRINLQSRPLAGILYSVSRDNCGELFPLYAGRNTIGSSPECDVYLSEETVSPNHAVLLIRSVVTENGENVVTMSITDYDSEYGTIVDGNKMGYDREHLCGNEIIEIGCGYKFLFVPLNATKFGLSMSSEFIATPRMDEIQMSGMSVNNYQPNPSVAEIYPNVVGESEERTFYGRTYAKKEDHSSKKTIN